MKACLHLAIPAGDLTKTIPFYTDIVGCTTGNQEKGKWIDINFGGNELTLHQSEERIPSVIHDVDMGSVPVPHFGLHLAEWAFKALKLRIEEAGLEYIYKPYRRFIGTKYEQETFFIADPNGNILEMKTMKNPEVLWEV